jgi:hypothetical protein
MGERNAKRALVGKPEGKTPLERFRRRWDGNIRMDRACSTHGRTDKCIQDFSGKETRKETSTG